MIIVSVSQSQQQRKLPDHARHGTVRRAVCLFTSWLHNCLWHPHWTYTACDTYNVRQQLARSRGLYEKLNSRESIPRHLLVLQVSRSRRLGLNSDGLETHQRFVSVSSRQKWKRLGPSVSAVYGFCHKLFPVAMCLVYAWRPWSRLHVIVPCKLASCVTITTLR